MYIIIETFGGAENAIIATDQEGNNLVYETWKEAKKEAQDFQEALIVEIE